MKKGILFCLLIAATVFFVACGDDSSSPNNANSAQRYVLPNNGNSGETGFLIDNRDGKIYKTVTIGSQTWMAENLNFETANSYCIDDGDPSSCAKYGRFYTWGNAMDSAGVYSLNGKGCGMRSSVCSPSYPVRGICPKGWHLPDTTEWKPLYKVIEKALSEMPEYTNEAVDESEFSVSGFDFYFEGGVVSFWSSTECSGKFTPRALFAFALVLKPSYDREYIEFDKDYLTPVRCLKD